MSSKEETIFGQNQNTVIAVASAVIFILATGMLIASAYQGASNGWNGYNVVAVTFSSLIALIFVSIAVYFGVIKAKESLIPGVDELKRLYASEKEKNRVVAAAAQKAKEDFLIAKSDIGQLVADAQVQRAKNAEDAAKKAAQEAIAAQAKANKTTAAVVAEIKK